VSDTPPLCPDAGDVKSASNVSSVSWVLFPAPTASCASWVAWQGQLKFHGSGAKLIHHIPSWHIRQSNYASCASCLGLQHHCILWFTTDRSSHQGHPWVFLGVVHCAFSAHSFTQNTTYCSLIITLNIYIPEASCIILHQNLSSNPESDTRMLLGLRLASCRYKVHPWSINTHEIPLYSWG